MNKTGARHNNEAAGNRGAWHDSIPEDDNPVVCDGGWVGVVVALADAVVAPKDAVVVAVVLAAGDAVVALKDAVVVAVVLAVGDAVVALKDAVVVAVVLAVGDAVVGGVGDWFEPKQTYLGSM